MPVLMQKVASENLSVFSANGRPSRPLKIAMCPPEWLPLQQAMTGANKADATYVIQKYVAENLQKARSRVDISCSCESRPCRLFGQWQGGETGAADMVSKPVVHGE